MKHKIEGIEPANHIKLEVFPAFIQLTSDTNPYTRNDFKAIVTDNYFYGILDSPTGPYLEIKEPLVSLEKIEAHFYNIITEENTYKVRKETHCACGSRLRGVHPFVGVPHIARLRKT